MNDVSRETRPDEVIATSREQVAAPADVSRETTAVGGPVGPGRLTASIDSGARPEGAAGRVIATFAWAPDSSAAAAAAGSAADGGPSPVGAGRDDAGGIPSTDGPARDDGHVSRETTAVAGPVDRIGPDAPPSVSGRPENPSEAVASPARADESASGSAADSTGDPNLDVADVDDRTGTRVAGDDAGVADVGPNNRTGVSRETPADDHGIDVSRETELDTPIAREALTAVHVLNVRQEQWPKPFATRVMTVANQKGGVGKTTSTVNIAAALALHGLRVLVIDLDPQGNASTALGVDHPVGIPSVYDVLLGERPLRDVIGPVEAAPGLFCAPATIDLAGADLELSSQVAREYRLQRALAAYLDEIDDAETPDYVFVDCPPSLGLLTLNALVAAREVFIPIQCEYYALEGLAQLLSTVEMVQSYLNQGLTVSTVLLTMYDSRTRLADQVADEVRAHFGELVIASVIPRNVRVSEAPGFGQTVMTYDAGSRGAVGYLQAARELAERGTREPLVATPASGQQNGGAEGSQA